MRSSSIAADEIPKTGIYPTVSPGQATMDCADAQDTSHDSPMAYAATLVKRFETRTDIDALEQAILLYEKVLTDYNTPDVTGRAMVELAKALRYRFLHSENSHDLQQSLEVARRACIFCESTPNESKATALLTLGETLRHYWLQHRNKADGDESIAQFRHVLDICQAEHPAHAFASACLGRILLQYYQRYHTLEDLDAAAQILADLLARISKDHPHRDVAAYCLANTSRFLYLLRGDLDDLARCELLCRETLIIRKPGHHLQSESLVTLAAALGDRRRKLGSAAASTLSESIELFREVLTLRPPGDSQRFGTLVDLAAVLAERFVTSSPSARVRSDLEEAIKLLRQSLVIPPYQRVAPTFYAYLNLANALTYRFTSCGAIPADLDECIEMRRKAVEHCPPKHVYYTTMLSSLAGSLGTRHSLFTAPEDLAEAVDVARAAIQSTSSDSPYYLGCIYILAGLLSEQYHTQGNLTALKEAIQILRDCSQSDEPIFTNYASAKTGVYTELGMALLAFYKHDGSESTLTEAIERLRHAKRLNVEQDSKSLGPRNLAQALMTRFKAYRNDQDACESLQLSEEAVELAPPGDVQRSDSLLQLADLYSMSGTPFRNVSTALSYLCQSLRDQCSSSQARLIGALPSLRMYLEIDSAERDSCLLQLLQAHSLAVDLLPRIAFFGMDPSARLSSLAKGANLAIDAACYALLANQPETAIQLFEQGRSLFWTQALRLRTPLYDDIPPELREDIFALARELEAASVTSSNIDMVERRRRSDNFETMLNRVRMLPGFERFLLHAEYSTLRRVAEQGPVIVLLAGALGCFAVVIDTRGTARCLILSDVKIDWLEKCAQSWRQDVVQSRAAAGDERDTRLTLQKKHSRTDDIGRHQNKILKDLWERVVKVAFDALDLLPHPHGVSRPRLWWCCASVFAFLPIHAAGVYPSGPCCDDYVVSSYTPTLDALLHVRKTYTPVRRDEARLLLAGVPVAAHTGLQDLPYTIAELRNIMAAAPSEQTVPLAPEDDALNGKPGAGMSASTLLSHLISQGEGTSKAVLLHLACHGVQDVNEPLQSGFVMRDEVLTIAKLLPVPLPRAFLAFLSACETAKGDRGQPDQTVHLAATMLFAGFKSVIATMWSMHDQDGPLVARMVYKRLFQADGDELKPDSVPQALNAAVQELRRQGVSPSRWAPYIHIGL